MPNPTFSRRTVLAAAAGAVVSVAASRVGSAPAADRIMEENAQGGTPFSLGGKASPATIEGYARQVSAGPGDLVELCVRSTYAYAVRVLRLGWYGGLGARTLHAGASRPATSQPAPKPPHPDTGLVRAGWETTDAFRVGEDWVSGYYIVRLELTDGPAEQRGRWAWIPLIVRPPATQSTDLLVQAPVSTWQAYNGWGGKSLYDSKSDGGVRASHVSFDRPYSPGGSRGGYDLFEWDYGVVRFLEREGYDVAYTTNIDVHRDPAHLGEYAAVLSVGHDEYWSGVQRDAFEDALAGGTSLAFLGGNCAYWQVRYEDDERTLVCFKDGESGADRDPVGGAGRTARFRDLQPPRPESELLGVEWDLGAEDYTGRREAYVQDATDPWWAGTGMSTGEALAGLVGYEWDNTGGPWSGPPRTVLWHRDAEPGKPAADAVRYTAASGAKVFSAGTMQLAWALDPFGRSDRDADLDRKLQRFMRNALADLRASSGGLGPGTPTTPTTTTPPATTPTTTTPPTTPTTPTTTTPTATTPTTTTPPATPTTPTVPRPPTGTTPTLPRRPEPPAQTTPTAPQPPEPPARTTPQPPTTTSTTEQPPPARPRPALSRVRLEDATIRRGRRAAVTARFRLAEPGPVQWTLERLHTPPRGAERWVRVSRGRRRLRAGVQALTLRLGTGTSPGTYRLTLVAREGAGISPTTKHLRFTVGAS